jgi:hypothetical protein
MLVAAAALWTAVLSGQNVSAPAALGRAAGPAPTPTKAPQVTGPQNVVLPAPPPAGQAAGAANPVQGASAFPPKPPGPPPFELAQIYYFEPGTGTRNSAWLQGNTWVLPAVDTMKAAGLTFLFDSKLPKQEISDVVEKRICCAELLVAGQPSQVTSLAFSGDQVFVRAVVPDMQSWPKTVQLHLFHSGGAASPADAIRASSPIGGAAPSGQVQAPVASFRSSSSAPILRPFMDYKSTLATVSGKRVSYFATFLYPTFSHARCTDCHSMGDAVALHNQHVAGGMPNVNGFDPKVAGCSQPACHSQIQDWRTPPFSKNVNWRGKSAREICSVVTGHLPSAEGLHKHFHEDPRVLWAVSSGWIPRNANGQPQPPLPTAPPHNAQAWYQLVDAWIAGGFPCPP